MMKKYLLFACLIFGWSAAIAQLSTAPATRIQEIDVNDFRGPVQANGTLWWDYSMGLGLEIPKAAPGAPRKITVFVANLWMGGVDASGTIRYSGETYRQTGAGFGPDACFFTGPIATTYTNQVPLIGDTTFNHVWKINRTEVLDFQLHHQQPGYQIPSAIATWPAEGNITGGRAPFIDTNSDGLYNPAVGDYPSFPGDQALYFIMNDEAQFRFPVSPAFEMETQGFVYSFDTRGNSSNLYDQTIFVRYIMTNRSPNDYHDFYFGHFVDFDLGYYNDDYIGCDRARQMMYAYNGDSLDESPNGYGANPPAQGVVLLSDSMAGFMYHENDFTPYGNPVQAGHYYNYLRGLWKNSQPVHTGGDGHSSNGPITKYMFDGDPVAGTGWTERNAGNLPGDRRGIMSAGPYTFAPNQTRTFDLAYVFAQSPQFGVNPSILLLRQKVDQLQAQYAAGVLSTPRAQETATTFTLSPNPATRTATIHVALPAGTATATLTLRDGLGRTVRTIAVREAATKLDLRGLAAGLYHATLSAPDGRALARQRLVVTTAAGE